MFVYQLLLFCFLQIDYAVRFHPEFGLTDGEGVERLWSFIRRFTAITKEMTPSHRIDLLTDGLIHYGRRKHAGIGNEMPTVYELFVLHGSFQHETSIVDLNANETHFF